MPRIHTLFNDRHLHATVLLDQFVRGPKLFKLSRNASIDLGPEINVFAYDGDGVVDTTAELVDDLDSCFARGDLLPGGWWNRKLGDVICWGGKDGLPLALRFSW